MTTHVISFSGGKDSTAMVLLARELAEHHGFEPLVVFADTGHEHPLTYQYVETVERHTGLTIRRVRADFAADMERKRGYIDTKWPAELEAGTPGRWELDKGFRQILGLDDDEPMTWTPYDPGDPPAALDGVYETVRAAPWTWRPGRAPMTADEARAVCDRAISLLQPTGHPFLDLCLWKGRFPSTRARFCSEELKHKPIWDQVLVPALRGRRSVLSWQGVRADESASRRHLPRWDRNDHPRLWQWRPILRWTIDDVFDMHRRHGLEPNPLYRAGMGRVGCMPCIHARKAELAEIARRFPEEIRRVAEWERLVSGASKRGISTFFANDKTPGPHKKDFRLPSPRIDEVAEWARYTGADGRGYDLEAMLADQDGPSTCSSLYGLCEGWIAPQHRRSFA